MNLPSAQEAAASPPSRQARPADGARPPARQRGSDGSGCSRKSNSYGCSGGPRSRPKTVRPRRPERGTAFAERHGVTLDGLMAEVRIAIGDQELVSRHHPVLRRAARPRRRGTGDRRGQVHRRAHRDRGRSRMIRCSAPSVRSRFSPSACAAVAFVGPASRGEAHAQRVAAASLLDAFQQIGDDFEGEPRRRRAPPVRGRRRLAAQIEQGAEADLRLGRRSDGLRRRPELSRGAGEDVRHEPSRPGRAEEQSRAHQRRSRREQAGRAPDRRGRDGAGRRLHAPGVSKPSASRSSARISGGKSCATSCPRKRT